jgi:hypothetical protein
MRWRRRTILHLWPLTNIALINCHFADLDVLEDARAAWCVALHHRGDLNRSAILIHWWPQRVGKRKRSRRFQYQGAFHLHRPSTSGSLCSSCPATARVIDSGPCPVIRPKWGRPSDGNGLHLPRPIVLWGLPAIHAPGRTRAVGSHVESGKGTPPTEQPAPREHRVGEGQ